MYYKNAAAVALVYDTTNEDTFVSIEKWVQEIDQNGAGFVQMAIVGNKCDIAEKQEVPMKSGMEYARKLKAVF